MSKQHTPGPWHVATKPEYDGEYITADRAVGGPTGHDEYDSELGVYAVIDGEPESLARPWLEADARLIAAAPDLLEAARYALNMLDQKAGGETVAARIGLIGGYYAHQLLRTAIARAEGQPQ